MAKLRPIKKLGKILERWKYKKTVKNGKKEDDKSQKDKKERKDPF